MVNSSDRFERASCSTESDISSTSPNRSSFCVSISSVRRCASLSLARKIDHRHVARLAVAMAATDPLLDTLRVPGQVVIDDRVTELQVEPLGTRFGSNEYAAAALELVHQRQPYGDVRTR